MAKKILVNLDLTGNQILNAKAQLLASDPGSPADGDFWINTTTNLFKVRMGGVTYVLGRVDQLNAPTGSVSMGSQKITNLADGTAASDAVNKGQLDAAQAGLDVKASVRVATTAAGTLATSFENGDTIDGVVLATGDRILIKNQATGSENGIYVVAASGAPTRAADADASAEVTSGMFVFVDEGTANADTGWVLTTNNPITLGTTALSFTKFTAAATGVAKSTATGPASTGTTFTHTHNLGTQEVVCQLRDGSTNAVVEADSVLTDANTVTYTFASSQTQNTLKSVVVG